MQHLSYSSMRLWQLISPTLPIGSYSCSQGLEYAVEVGWVRDETSARRWILGQIEHNLSRLDVPVFLRMFEAWNSGDMDDLNDWNHIILALRESAELRTEDANLGRALIRVLNGLDLTLPEMACEETAFVTAFSFACHHWSIDRLEAARGLLWSWCENQVAAAIKLVPLGQTSGQCILSQGIGSIESAIETALQCNDEDIGLLAPGLAIASALHETQYTRLFRS